MGPTPAQFSAWDGELSHNDVGGNGTIIPLAFTNCTDTSSPIAKLFCSLSQSTDFLSLLSTRLDLHTAPGGALSTDVALARWDTINQFIDSAIVGESARWGDALWDLGGQYAVRRTRNVDWRINNAEIRSILQGKTLQLINAVKAAGFYVSRAPVPVSAAVSVSTPVMPPVAPPVAVI